MIDMGATEFFFETPKMTRDELEAYTDQLFDSWEAYIPSVFSLDDYSIVLEIEEGSIKGNGKLYGALAGAFVFVCQYGSFIQGLQIMRGQVVAAGEYLSKIAKENSRSNASKTIIKHRAGSLGQIHKLFIKVQRQEISVDQAMQEANRILGEDAESCPEFMEKLKTALENAPVHGQQIDLPLDDVPLEPNSDGGNTDSAQRSSRTRVAIIPKHLLRIEISRESKRGKKTIKVIEL